MTAHDLSPPVADPQATVAAPAASFPWDEDSLDTDAAGGQTKGNKNVEPADDRRRSHRGNAIPVYLAGFAGTILAGALFPIATLVVFAATENAVPSLQDFLRVLAIGSLTGGLFAGAAAACIFPLVALVQHLAGLSRSRAAMASIAGGWSGVAASQWLFGQRASGDPTLTFQLLTLIALLMGQVGAGWFARSVRRWQTRSRPEGNPEAPDQFSLRQLLGLTAGVAVIAAIVSALKLPPQAPQAIVWSLLLQGSLICLYFAVARSRRFT